VGGEGGGGEVGGRGGDGAGMDNGLAVNQGPPGGGGGRRGGGVGKTLRERSVEIRMIDVGGGLGIRYHDETPPTHEEYATVLLPALRESGATVLLEPGRSIVGNAGVLLTRVLYRKDTGAKKFVVIDAAMNDLVRPSFYRSFHPIPPVDHTARTPP